MNRSDVHAYWRDPETDKYNAGPSYRAACQPEFYVGLKAVSDMWLQIFERFVPKESTILELGCSVGRNLHYLNQAGYRRASGVEISAKAKALAFPDVAGLIFTSSIEDYLSHDPSPFDVVFTSGVLMHIHPDSEWIFAKMAQCADQWLMCAEVEEPVGIYKWPRNYRAIFEAFDFQQVHEQEATPMSNRTILRVFQRGR